MYNVMRFGALIIVASTLLYVPESVLESAQAGHRVPMLNAMVPGLPIGVADGWRNYAIVYAFHAVLVFLAGMGTCAADMMTVMLVMHMLPLADLFAGQMRELNAALRDARRPSDHAARQSPEFARFFRNVVQQHRESAAFLRSLARIYYYVYLMEINADALSLCVLIVCHMQMEWLGIYPLVLLYASKLFAYCVLGTMAEVGTERVYAALVACDWYELCYG